MNGQPDSTPEGQRFSLIVGGPFNRLLGRLGLLDPDGLPSPRAALCIALIAWLAPALAALAQDLFDHGEVHALAYLADVSMLARMFIAVGILILTERHADERLSTIVRVFWSERIVVGEARARFFDLLRAADRQSSSAIAQLLMLVFVMVSSGQAIALAISIEGSGWEGAMVDGQPVLSWAGAAARWISIPVFEFLILLWLWRFAIWSLLLFRIARLPLELTPLHADRCAGLGFLGMFPGVFRGFVFGLSCVVAALLLKDLQAAQPANPLEMVRDVGLLWAGVVLVLTLGPLFAFYNPLYRLREAELTLNGRAVNGWYREFHRRWFSGEAANDAEPGPLGPSLDDLNNAYDTLSQMRAVPIDMAVVKQLLLVALLPIAIVGATRMPLRELLGSIAGFVF